MLYGLEDEIRGSADASTWSCRHLGMQELEGKNVTWIAFICISF